MGEKSDQIEREIQAERGQLGHNLNELQSKVQDFTDWRAQFQKRPIAMMGVAVGGGLLLASLTGRRSRVKRYSSGERSDGFEHHGMERQRQKGKALEAFDTIKGAMIAVAANTFQDFFAQIVPGFKEQLQKTALTNATRMPETAGPAKLRANIS
jgi:hypothetical protein